MELTLLGSKYRPCLSRTSKLPLIHCNRMFAALTEFWQESKTRIPRCPASTGLLFQGPVLLLNFSIPYNKASTSSIVCLSLISPQANELVPCLWTGTNATIRFSPQILAYGTSGRNLSSQTAQFLSQ